MALNSNVSKRTAEQIAQRVHEVADDAIRVKQVEPITATINDTVEFTGTVETTPPTDFEVRTITVTNTPQALVVPNFDIFTITISADDQNPGPMRFGKSDVLTNSFQLPPGSSVTLNTQASVDNVYIVLGVGVASGQVSVLFEGNPVP